MSASLALALAAAQLNPIVVPLGKPPRQVEKPIAPIEIAGPAFAAACEKGGDDTPAPPVRIHGNTYLVGTCGIAALLITGTRGHILIDGGTEAGANVIAKSIRSLGFRLSDVEYILHSHEHFDHVAGIARLQRLTGAQVVASVAAAPVLNTGLASADDPQAGMHAPFPAAHVDRMIKDGNDIRLGNLAVTAVATPGHTPGALTWHWGSCDGGACRRIVFADSLNPISRDDYRFSDHPALLRSFRKALGRVAKLECDILLTPHPSASNMVGRLALAKIDSPNGCRDYAALRTKHLDERLAKEAAGPANAKP